MSGSSASERNRQRLMGQPGEADSYAIRSLFRARKKFAAGEMLPLEALDAVDRDLKQMDHDRNTVKPSIP